MSCVSIFIRATSDHDIDAIASIYSHAVVNTTATYELEPPSRDSMQSRIERIRDAGYPCFVAEESCADRKVVVGYAYASPFRPRAAYRFTVEHSVYVAPGERGRGVGRLLMEAVINECERLGFRQLVAVIGDGGKNEGSMKFHERLGFRHSGRLEGSGYKFGCWLDTVYMQLKLGGGTSSPPDPASMPEKGFRNEETN
jgi:phosphinothricin acetyltransferase